MYTGNPLTNPVDALRLEFGDVDQDFPRMSDESYMYYLTQHFDKPNRLRREIGMAILAALSAGVRERSGQEERYGSEEFNNYLKWLNLKVSGSALSGICPLIYVGGVDRAIVDYYENNPDFIDATFFKGYTTRKPASRHIRRIDAFGLSNPEERVSRGVFNGIDD